MRILKFSFWIAIVVIFLPASNDNEPDKKVTHRLNVPATAQDVVTAAAAAGTDISTFCTDQPALCRTGAAALKVFKEKAENGLHIMAPWDDTPKPQGESMLHASADKSGAAMKHAQKKPNGVSSNTLKIEDLIPEWKTPKGSAKS
ncbi:MAG: DUF5330 domain-containing protein [Hyphomicrobiales bacterium]